MQSQNYTTICWLWCTKATFKHTNDIDWTVRVFVYTDTCECIDCMHIRRQQCLLNINCRMALVAQSTPIQTKQHQGSWNALFETVFCSETAVVSNEFGQFHQIKQQKTQNLDTWQHLEIATPEKQQKKLNSIDQPWWIAKKQKQNLDGKSIDVSRMVS